MANDIQKIIENKPIKNRSVIVATCPRGGFIQTLDRFATNKPTIEEIENKYSGRFNDISYYSIGNTTLIGG